MLDKYYTRKEVAEILRTDAKTVYIWIKQGKLKATRIGRKWLITEASVKAAMQEPGDARGAP